MNTKIDLYYFIISLFIGLYVVYITTPKPLIILEHPKNNEHFINIENGIKYKYKYENINCSIK